MKSRSSSSSFCGWKNAILLFLIMGLSGFGLYSVVVIFPVMLEALNWKRGMASLALTINVLMVGPASILIALSIDKFGNKKTIIFGLMVILLTAVLLGTIVGHIWIWIAIWGVLAPIGFNFGGLIPILANVMLWFNIRRALVVGLVMTSMSVGGFLSQPLCSWIMETGKSWQYGWFSVALAGCIALIISFFIIEKPGDIGQYPDGINPNETESYDGRETKSPKTYRSDINWPLKEVFKTSSVWLILVVAIGFIQALMLITSHGVLHFTDNGYTAMQSASILSVIILASGIAGIPMGALADVIEPKWIISFAMIGMFVTLICLWKAANIELLLITGAMFGFGYGTILVLIPAVAGNYYGPETFPKINGVLAPIGTAVSSVIPLVAGVIADRTGSYDIMFILISIILLAGGIGSFFIKPPEIKFKY